VKKGGEHIGMWINILIQQEAVSISEHGWEVQKGPGPGLHRWGHWAMEKNSECIETWTWNSMKASEHIETWKEQEGDGSAR